MADSAVLTPVQHTRERSVLFWIFADLGFLSLMTASGVLGGSLTMIAESLRAWLALAVETFSFVVLRRIHRGNLRQLEYGSGKLEQVANVAIGASMLVAAAWIAVNALATIAGEREIGTPFGLAVAAIVGSANCYINLLAWDSVRRAAAGGRSLIMEAQVTLRVVKLVASLVVGVTMAIAALSSDHVVVVWADALGGLFVSVYMLFGGVKILREAIPDLLDSSAGVEVAAAVERCLARNREHYTRVDTVRSRRSGHTVFVEIALAFAADLTVAEVQRRIATIRASLQNDIGNSDIAILTVSTDDRGPSMPQRYSIEQKPSSLPP